VAALVIAQRRRLAMHQEYAARILDAHEEERAWIAGELHDDALQRVVIVRHELEQAWAALPPAVTAPEKGRLQALNAELLDLGVTLRNLAQRLHPTIVEQLGLPRAVEALVGEVVKSTGLELSLSVPATDQRLPPKVAHVAYRVVQEALRNVVKHSGARAAEVSLALDRDQLVVRVADAGCGFAYSDADGGRRADDDHGLGLAAMQERVRRAKGTLAIRSRVGEGTTIEARLPRGSAE
jgi:signal transduction histidine kinase